MELFYGLLLSTHLGLEADYNSIHPHIGVYLDDEKIISSGVYYNSESEISTYVAYRYDFTYDLNAEIGMVTGYTGMAVKPMIKFNYDNYFVSPTVETILKDGKAIRHNGGLVVGVEWRH